jgi:hypothetical protein
VGVELIRAAEGSYEQEATTVDEEKEAGADAASDEDADEKDEEDDEDDEDDEHDDEGGCSVDGRGGKPGAFT